MASASPDNIKQWKFPDGNFLQNCPGHNSIINTLAVNEDGVMVSGGMFSPGHMHTYLPCRAWYFDRIYFKWDQLFHDFSDIFSPLGGFIRHSAELQIKIQLFLQNLATFCPPPAWQDSDNNLLSFVPPELVSAYRLW